MKYKGDSRKDLHFVHVNSNLSTVRRLADGINCHTFVVSRILLGIRFGHFKSASLSVECLLDPVGWRKNFVISRQNKDKTK